MSDININGERKCESLGEIFFTYLQRNKHEVFLYIDELNETLTYGNALEWSIRTAMKLKEKGVRQEDIISSCTYNGKYSSVPFIATQFLGAISMNFAPQLPQLDTIHLLKLIKPKILFVDDDSLERMELCLNEANVTTEVVVIGKSRKYSQFSEYIEPRTNEETFEPTHIENNEKTAIIFSSSGTTGLPKGICLSHKAALATIPRPPVTCDSKKNENINLMVVPLYGISAIISLARCIVGNYSMVVCREFNPSYAWRLIEKYKVTNMFLIPYDVIKFLQVKPMNVDLSSLKYFITGSDAVPETSMEKLKQALPTTKVTIMYGITEAAGIITLFNIGSPEEYELQLKKPRSCGKICRGLKWKVVDPTTEQILGPHEEGEMRIKSDGYLMSGYYNMDSSFVFDSEGYFKTGDLVYYDEDECFFIVDRLNEIFKYRGCPVVPALIENILLSHPAVEDAAVIGIPHDVDAGHAMAVVVLFDGHDESCAHSIEAFVNERVSNSQKLRAGVRVVDSIPKTGTGKTARRLLRKQILESIKKQ